MKNTLRLLSLFLLLTSAQLIAQKYTISGYVEDAATGERMVGVNVVAKELSLGTTTNTFGFYSLTLPSSEFNLEMSFIGYQKSIKWVNLVESIQVNVGLESQVEELDEIVLIGEETIVKQTQSSVIDVPVQQIKSMPALLGEVDVLKAIQLLPGVQSGSEGTSGFYVRGGGPDQNLILLDGVPVYNASHLFGFFSVFNADAIKNVRLTKGGFPARFGGRLSSVLEIDMKEGNMKEYKGNVSVGLIASRMTVEGPIQKDKSSFIISARRTYADVLAQPFIMAAGDGERAGYYFYDLNTKFNYKFSEKDRVYWSAYLGDDRFYGSYNDGSIGETDKYKFGLGWGNKTSSLRWNHLFSDKLFSNTMLTYSKYMFSVENTEEYAYQNEAYEYMFNYYSGIEDLGARIDFDYLPNPNHYVKFGVNYINHTFYPGQLDLREEESDEDYYYYFDTSFVFSDRIYADDFSVYLEDDIKVGERFKVNMGLHASAFKVKGENYFSLQPRFQARYLLTEDWALKASYAEMQQNVHLLTNSDAGLPTDIWVPATDKVKPQYSRQIAGSLTRVLKEGVYELSIEGYYKTMSDLISYKEGSSFMSFQDWQETVETGGQGESYGLELFLQKKRGKTSGWIGYTLSWTNRRFDNINFGEWYPYKYDRRHDMSVVLSHEFSKTFDMGFTWVYGTGNAISFPQATYWALNEEQNWTSTIEYFGEKNSSRMNAYHRMDLVANFHKEKKNGVRTLSVGLYNAYNRKNPYFVYLGYEQGRKTARQVSLFPMIPSITYNFKF
jgi:hypothetical protein